MGVVFKCNAGEFGIEVEGSEEFVRSHVEFLLPWVRRMTGAPEPGAAGAGGAAEGGPAGIEGVAGWWRRNVPGGASPSLQDTILVFAYFMRSYRKTVFLSEDIRRCFQVMGLEEPKSLLQILGTLKRDQGLLLPAGKRGEYMMSIPGINRARGILGVKATSSPGASAALAGEPLVLEPARGVVDARNIFKD